MTINAEREQALLDATPTELYIRGDWVPATSANVLDVTDPATGDVLTSVADATAADALDALTAAADAQVSWRRTPPRTRADILRRAHDLVTARHADLALLITLEMGKPLAEAKAEVTYAAGFLRWYSEEAVRISGRYTSTELGTGRIVTIPQPVGPCLFVTPWNFPLAMGTRKIGPALAAGCTCVVKPAAQAPLSMLLLADIFDEAGLPAGVLNVITGRGAGRLVAPLMSDPRLRKVSFTGSTEVGRLLVRQAAEHLLRVSMELGGNAPFLVFADADLDAAVDGAVIAKMRNGGEACTSANRFYVHESVAERFARRLAERLAAMRVGRGTEAGVHVGPLIDQTQRLKVDELVHDAVDRGARVLAGGKSLGGPGYFYSPTVLTDVPTGTRLLREEIFGPVAPIVPFGDDAEAVSAANDCEYGLAAYVYTRDLGRGFAVSEALETGMVALNQGVVSNVGAPFGGIKASGYGREGGPEGIAEYLETKYLALNAGLEPDPTSTKRTS